MGPEEIPQKKDIIPTEKEKDMTEKDNNPTEKDVEKLDKPDFKAEINEIKTLYKTGDKKNALEILHRSFESFNNNRELLENTGREEDHIEADYYSTFRDFGGISGIKGAHEVIASMRVTEHNKNQYSIRGRIDNLLNVVNGLIQEKDETQEPSELNNIKKQLQELLKNLDDTKPKPEKVEEIRSTVDFQNLIDSAKEENEEGVLKTLGGLEQYLQNVRQGLIDKDKRLEESGDWKDGGRWIDHREGELFNNYIELKNWLGAKRIIESMQDTSHNEKYNSKDGRIKHLEKMSGLKYDEIKI